MNKGCRANRDFWASPAEAELTLLVVRDNPRKPGEGPTQYIERIAILSGLMPPGRAAFVENARLGQTSSAPSESAAPVKSDPGRSWGHSGAQPWPAKEWGAPFVDSEERRGELRRQAEEIVNQGS